MPRCLLYSARDYRTGNYNGGRGHDNNVMMTRSGLSIKKVPTMKSSSVTRAPLSPTPPSPSILKKEEKVGDKRRKKHAHKSLSYMSFVTRYYLCLRVPEFDLAGFSTGKKSSGSRTRALVNEFQYLSVLDSDYDSNDDDMTGNDAMDRFILNASENMNNNQIMEDVTDINGHTSEIHGRPSMSCTSSSDRGCPLVNFFGDNRLDAENADNLAPLNRNTEESHSYLGLLHPLLEETAQTDQDEDSQSQLGSDAESSQGTADTVDSDTVFINASQLDSEDSSSICSDITIDVDDGIPTSVAQGSVSTVSQYGTSPMVMQTRTIKLRDVQLTLNVIDVADGQKVIKCSECDHIFLTVSDYVPHLKTHMKSKNKCFLCGKLFSRSWLLKGHMRTHTGEKPFPCPHVHCTRAFADKSNLRSHLLTHSGSKETYRCGKCGRGFAQKRYLHKHNLEVCRFNIGM